MKTFLAFIFTIAILLAFNIPYLKAQNCTDSLSLLNQSNILDGTVAFSTAGRNALPGSNYGAVVKIGKGRLHNSEWVVASSTFLANACTNWLDILVVNPADYTNNTKIIYKGYLRLPNGNFIYTADSILYTVRKRGHGFRLTGHSPYVESNSSVAFEPGKLQVTRTNLKIISQEEFLLEDVAISVYPNPMKSQTLFANLDLLEAQVIRIYDLAGQLISELPVPEGTSEVIFEKGKLIAGLYFYTIMNANGEQVNGKLLIE